MGEGARAGGGRGKQHVQTVGLGSSEGGRGGGGARLTALMNVKNKLRYVT